MTRKILAELRERRRTGRKSFAVLLDPDKTDATACLPLIRQAQQHGVDYLLVGGSLITHYTTAGIIQAIKDYSDIPIILFPGSSLHVEASADAILLLSLISGRNADFLIGQHVVAAPILRQTTLEILPTGYMLVESGTTTTASYISNTLPLPRDKPDIAACTAMAGEMLGLQLLYLDAGSGAQRPVDPAMVAAVRRSVALPLLVGGGLRSAQQATDALRAGADLLVVGNGIEQQPTLLADIARATAQCVPQPDT